MPISSGRQMDMYKLGQYVFRESPVHSRDPRVKLIAVIALSIITLRVNFVGLLVASAMAIAISQLAHLSQGSVLRTDPWDRCASCEMAMAIALATKRPTKFTRRVIMLRAITAMSLTRGSRL